MSVFQKQELMSLLEALSDTQAERLLALVRDYVAKRADPNEHLDPITVRISRMNLPTGDWEILETQIEAGRLGA